MHCGDTLIIIDIQANNRAEIVQCVQNTFEYMPGWVVASAATYASTYSPDSRFFCFNFTYRTFDWWRTNGSASETIDNDEMPIKDLADISNLLEFVYLNTDRLRVKEDPSAEVSSFDTTSQIRKMIKDLGNHLVFENPKG